MTNLVSAYNFMDLLKDKGFAPQTDVTSHQFATLLNGVFGKLSSQVEQTATHYDFMDLMQDKGFVPAPSNDNDLNVRVA